MTNCKYCNQEITWNPNRKIRKWHSRNTLGLLHECVNNLNKLKQKEKFEVYDGFLNKIENRFEPKSCKNGCGELVTFNPKIRYNSGRLIPLNLDYTIHKCYNVNDNSIAEYDTKNNQVSCPVQYGPAENYKVDDAHTYRPRQNKYLRIDKRERHKKRRI